MKNFLRKALVFVICSMLLLGYSEKNIFASNNINIQKFKNINIDDGLSQSSIYSLFQDSKGYMWIGTSDGLNKYNTHKFKIYRNKKNDKNTISGNTIKDIQEDKEGNIWVATTSGLNKINRSTNEITRYLPNDKEFNISNQRIREILIATNGEIFVATDDGLNKYDEKNDTFIRIYNSENDNEALSHQEVYSIVEDIYGDYWIGTRNGINKIDNKTGELIKIFVDEEKENSISSNFIYKLYADKKGYLWVGTYYGGLNKIDIKTGEIEIYFPDGVETNIPGAYIRDILRDSKDRMWIATDFGFTNLNEETKKFTTYKNIEYDNESMMSDDILSILEDNTGMIWVGTYNGISMFNPNNVFTNYKKDPFNDNSLSENEISGIYEDNDGLLWIGSVHKGVNILDRKSGNITRVDEVRDIDEELAVSNNLIREIVGKDEEIWIATQNGLDRYNKKVNAMSHFKEEDGIVNNDILSLCIDNSGVVWIGTVSGICSYKEGEGFRSYSDELEKIGVKGTNILDIYEDGENNIWFATGRGNGLIKYSENKFFRYCINDEEDNSYDSILTINSNDDEYLYLGTDSTIIKFNKETKEKTIYTEKDELLNSVIYGILFDDDGNLWFSTNYGISKFDLEKDKITSFDAADGVQANEFNQYSYYKSKSGEMFFGGINGLTIFNPKDIKEKSFIPKVQIERLETAYGDVYISDKVNLGYKQNQLRFDFFMPDYSNTKKIKYAYRLYGLEKDWTYIENDNNAKYTNLEAGTYKFQVVGKSSSGEWSEINEIVISIDSPPWKSPIAYSIYLIVVIMILFHIKNKVNILDSLVKERTLELNNKLVENEELYTKLLRDEQYKNNYFVNLSHELRTPLNLIVSAEQLINKLNEDKEPIEKGKIKYYMNIIKRNSNRLQNLIDNIINTSKIEAGNYKLNIESNDIVYLVEEVALSMKDYIENKGIELIVDPEVEEKIIECDSSDIEKIILNLISNAVKFTSEGGKIEVKLFDLKDSVKIVVEDTGIGIEESKHESIFNRFDQAYSTTSEEYGGSGLGLTLTRQLVELHKGTISIESKLGEGSKFIIILPVNGG